MWVSTQGYRHFSSLSRRTAALSGFLHLSHSFEGPLRYGACVRFDTMPSSPMRQTCRKMMGPSPSRCSTNRMPRRWDLPSSFASRRLRSVNGRSRQVDTIVLDQIKGVQRRLMAPALASERAEVGCSVLISDHGLAIDQERCRLDAAGSVCDSREAVRPIMTPAREAAHPLAVAPYHQTIAIVLDLMNPVRPGWWLQHTRRLAWCD